MVNVGEWGGGGGGGEWLVMPPLWKMLLCDCHGPNNRWQWETSMSHQRNLSVLMQPYSPGRALTALVAGGVWWRRSGGGGTGSRHIWWQGNTNFWADICHLSFLYQSTYTRYTSVVVFAPLFPRWLYLYSEHLPQRSIQQTYCDFLIRFRH